MAALSVATLPIVPRTHGARHVAPPRGRTPPGIRPTSPSQRLNGTPTGPATAADTLAHAGIWAWAEYTADPTADEVVSCPPTRRTALPALLDVVRCGRPAPLVRLSAPRTILDMYSTAKRHFCYMTCAAMPFWRHRSATKHKAWRSSMPRLSTHSEDREEQSATQHRGMLPPSSAFYSFSFPDAH